MKDVLWQLERLFELMNYFMASPVGYKKKFFEVTIVIQVSYEDEGRFIWNAQIIWSWSIVNNYNLC